jgi:DNA polymerase III alpha subunit (gram-positive type)
MSETGRVMVDLETLGLEPGASIISIGAVWFTEHGLGDEFYRSVDLASCQDYGLEIDADTLDWWLHLDAGLQDQLKGGDDLPDVLFEFREFYTGADEIWAFSPSFDCEILGHAYEQTEMAKPWTYRDERDARTIAALPTAPDVDRDGDEHHALDDARHQARMVSQVMADISQEGGR